MSEPSPSRWLILALPLAAAVVRRDLLENVSRAPGPIGRSL